MYNFCVILCNRQSLFSMICCSLPVFRLFSILLCDSYILFDGTLILNNETEQNSAFYMLYLKSLLGKYV